MYFYYYYYYCFFFIIMMYFCYVFLLLFFIFINGVRYIEALIFDHGSRTESRKSLSETEFPIFYQNIINHLQKAHFIK